MNEKNRFFVVCFVDEFFFSGYNTKRQRRLFNEFYSSTSNLIAFSAHSIEQMNDNQNNKHIHMVVAAHFISVVTEHEKYRIENFANDESHTH